MRILVTGGAGFIGRWVVKGLLDGGNEVTALDDLSNVCLGISKNSGVIPFFLSLSGI